MTIAYKSDRSSSGSTPAPPPSLDASSSSSAPPASFNRKVATTARRVVSSRPPDSSFDSNNKNNSAMASPLPVATSTTASSQSTTTAYYPPASTFASVGPPVAAVSKTAPGSQKRMTTIATQSALAAAAGSGETSLPPPPPPPSSGGSKKRTKPRRFNSPPAPPETPPLLSVWRKSTDGMILTISGGAYHSSGDLTLTSTAAVPTTRGLSQGGNTTWTLTSTTSLSPSQQQLPPSSFVVPSLPSQNHHTHVPHQPPSPLTTGSNRVIVGLLPEDTYSFLALPSSYLTLGLSWAAMAIQLITLFILAMDVLNFQDTVANDPLNYQPDNPLGVPPNVATEVAACQLVALLITLLSQSNVTWALNVALNGFEESLIRYMLQVSAELATGNRHHKDHHHHARIGNHQREEHQQQEQQAFLISKEGSVKSDPEGQSQQVEEDGYGRGANRNPVQQQTTEAVTAPLSHHSHHHPHVSLSALRWHGANLLRLGLGVLSLMASFVLIVRSNNVLDILLNFTAIEFISHIDNTFFKLGQWGYFGHAVMKDAQRPITNESNFVIRHRVARKTDGNDNNTTTDLDGGLEWWKVAFLILTRIGLFVIFVGAWSLIYRNQNRGDFRSSTIFLQLGDLQDLALGTYSGVYDRTPMQLERRFVYQARIGQGQIQYCKTETAWILVDPLKLDSNHTCGWMAISEISTAFEVLKTALTPWYIDTSFNIRTPTDHFILTAHSVRLNPQDNCFLMGPKRYGWNCQLLLQCSKLSVSRALNLEPFPGERDYPTDFDWAQGHSVYRYPFFYAQNVLNAFDVVLFLGRRWYLLNSAQWDFNQTGRPPTTTDELLAHLQEGFFAHTLDPSLGIEFVSEPVDVGLQGTETPIGLQWFRAFFIDGGEELIVENEAVNTRFLCGTCESSDDCEFGGTCVDTVCECPIGTLGRNCESSPVDNGYCNVGANTVQFFYDGGDCCLSTCSNSNQFACGRVASGFEDIRNLMCIDGAVGPWSGESDLLVGVDALSAGFGTAVGILHYGTQVVVGASTGEFVSSYTNYGSAWSAETTVTRTREELSVGYAIWMAQTVPNAINNPLAPVPFVLVTAAITDIGEIQLNAYHCKAVRWCFMVSFSTGPVVAANNTVIPTTPFFQVDGDQLNIPNILSDHRIVYPSPAVALSPDGRWLFVAVPVKSVDTTESVLHCYTWEPQKREWQWRQQVLLGEVLVVYASCSSVSRRIAGDRNMEHVTVALGSKNIALYPNRTDQPLDVRLLRIPTEPTAPSSWSASNSSSSTNVRSSDHHMLDRTGRLLPIPGGRWTNGDLISGQDRVHQEFPYDSLLLSENGEVLVISSFFLPEESDLSYDLVFGSGATTSLQQETEFMTALRGRVVVYERRGSMDFWDIRHTFDMGARDSVRDGWRTSISGNGAILVIGTADFSTVYGWNGQVYEIQQELSGFSSLQQHRRADLSLVVSGDGSTVAVGSPTEEGTGRVHVYRNDHANPCPHDKPLLLHLSFTTGQLPANPDSISTFWEVRELLTGVVLREGGPKLAGATANSADLSSNMTFVYQECFAAQECTSMTWSSPSSALPFGRGREGTTAIFFNRKEVVWTNFTGVSTSSLSLAVPAFNRSEVGGKGLAKTPSSECEVVVYW